jgi:hypothetical protein
MKTIQTFFKTEGQVNSLDFGSGQEFNHIRGDSVYRAFLRKELVDSYRMDVEVTGENIDTLKLTNQQLLTWDDHWIDPQAGLCIDPLIRSVNLQRNSLVYANFSVPRAKLEELNLEGNGKLTHLYIHCTPELKKLNLSGCTSLQHISMGENKEIMELNAKDCNLSTSSLEQLLRDFRPTITSSANDRGAGMFRKTHSTLLDLRGNPIDWSNRKIASKIRMLLCNNWIVKWDVNPPTEVIPPALYAFYVESKIANRIEYGRSPDQVS